MLVQGSKDLALINQTVRLNQEENWQAGQLQRAREGSRRFFRELPLSNFGRVPNHITPDLLLS